MVALLTRVGASTILPDVVALAERLVTLAAVVEAVHGEVLAGLWADRRPSGRGTPAVPA